MVAMISLTSCQSEKGLKISAKSLPAELNGANVMVMPEGGEPTDTVVIADGAFNLAVNAEEVGVWHLVMNDQYLLVFFSEQGKLEVVPVANEEGVVTSYEFAGDPSLLTIQYSQIQKELTAISEPFYTKLQALDKEIRETNEDGRPTEEQYNRVMAVQEEYVEAINDKLSKSYEAHKDDAIGTVLFPQLQFEGDAEFIAAYEAANDKVKENEHLVRRYETALKAQETSVGRTYKDFEMDNGEGETRALSSFMNGEDYLLIDFFASWCGPCRRSIPEIAKLNDNYGKRGLNILSIGTWENSGTDDAGVALTNHQVAVKDWGITWDHYYDSKNVGATEYGVPGIPMLLLISPEGEILVRTHSVADVKVKLEELLHL